MRYSHRDRANRAIPTLCALVLGGLDLALVIAGPSLPWAVRTVLLVVLGLAACLVQAAVPQPERAGWLILLAGFAGLTAFPPADLFPTRAIFGALLLAGLLGLMVWHARQKRTALWSRS